MLKKGIALVVILLLISVSVIPSASRLMYDDDTTPPVTTHSLNPPEPDGDNGWYVDDVEVTLNATDDLSGVKEIKYRVGTGEWKTIQGSEGTFTLTIADDENDLLIEYYAIDNVGNEESINSFTIDMDQTIPDMDAVECKPYMVNGTWYLRFYCNATDATSGMDRVEMFVGDVLYKIINGSGANYEFVIKWTENLKCYTIKFIHYDVAGNLDTYEFPSIGSPPPPPFIRGFICNPKVNDKNISFLAIFVIYSYYEDYKVPKRELFVLKHLSCYNDYGGYIGRFFIWANFFVM